MQENLEGIRTEGQTGQDSVWASATSPAIKSILCIAAQRQPITILRNCSLVPRPLLSSPVSGLQLFWWCSYVVRLARVIQLLDPTSIPKSDIRCWESLHGHHLRRCVLGQLKNPSPQRFRRGAEAGNGCPSGTWPPHRKRWDITLHVLTMNKGEPSDCSHTTKEEKQFGQKIKSEVSLKLSSLAMNISPACF